MAEGKRKPRLIVELVTSEEMLFARQVRAAAALKGISLRAWILEAMREKYAREQ
jgi:predicted HicB family RNase H-like nuclease